MPCRKNVKMTKIESNVQLKWKPIDCSGITFPCLLHADSHALQHFFQIFFFFSQQLWSFKSAFCNMILIPMDNRLDCKKRTDLERHNFSEKVLLAFFGHMLSDTSFHFHRTFVPLLPRTNPWKYLNFKMQFSSHHITPFLSSLKLEPISSYF